MAGRVFRAARELRGVAARELGPDCADPRRLGGESFENFVNRTRRAGGRFWGHMALPAGRAAMRRPACAGYPAEVALFSRDGHTSTSITRAMRASAAWEGRVVGVAGGESLFIIRPGGRPHYPGGMYTVAVTVADWDGGGTAAQAWAVREFTVETPGRVGGIGVSPCGRRLYLGCEEPAPEPWWGVVSVFDTERGDPEGSWAAPLGAGLVVTGAEQVAVLHPGSHLQGGLTRASLYTRDGKEVVSWNVTWSDTETVLDMVVNPESGELIVSGTGEEGAPWSRVFQ
jgi:hypothetical protein